MIVFPAMAMFELLVIVTFAALAACTDTDEQKKRATDKGTSLNSITAGAQKDYTYSIYSQNPSSQTSQQSSYQSQVPNSFYPNQGSSQYYSSSNNQADTSYHPQQQPHQPSTQFVPLNFVPSSGYQSKYQIVGSKPNGNVQFAIVQPNSYPTAPVVPYAPSLFSSNAASRPHQSLVNSVAPGHYNVAPNYQPFAGSYLSPPSTMLLFAQPNPSLYNNFVYPNPVQNLYNYHPSNSQSKYTPYTSGSTEYDKLQGPIAPSVPKEENDITYSGEYTGPSDSNSSYKSPYSASRNTYSKL